MDATPLLDPDRIKVFLKREARHWGTACRSRRQALQLTLDNVASLAGTTPQTVFKVERGEIVARDNLRISLAFALSCEVGDLFPMPTRKIILAEAAA